MKIKVFLAFAFAFGCAVFWLAIAFIVAFPKEIFSAEFAVAATKFMDDDHLLERIFFPLLVVVDILIDAALGHSRFRKWSAWAAVVAGAVYTIFMLALPLAGEGWNNDGMMIVFWIGMLCLLFIRWASFFEVEKPDLKDFGSVTPDPAPAAAK